MKHTKSQACEAKGYYPLTLQMTTSLTYVFLMYNGQFLVCRSICMPHAVHMPGIMDNLVKTILDCLRVYVTWYTCTFGTPVHLNDLQKTVGFCL